MPRLWFGEIRPQSNTRHQAEASASSRARPWANCLGARDGDRKWPTSQSIGLFRGPSVYPIGSRCCLKDLDCPTADVRLLRRAHPARPQSMTRPTLLVELQRGSRRGPGRAAPAPPVEPLLRSGRKRARRRYSMKVQTPAIPDAVVERRQRVQTAPAALRRRSPGRSRHRHRSQKPSALRLETRICKVAKRRTLLAPSKLEMSCS